MAPTQHPRGGNVPTAVRHRSSWSASRRRNAKNRRNFGYRLRENFGAISCKNELVTAFLNVDGLSDARLDDVSSFVSSKSPDLFFLLETKRRAEEVASDISTPFPGYDLTEIRRSDVSGDRKGGGIAFYTKNNGGLLFKRHSPDILHADLEYVEKERFWVTIDSLQCKTAICGVYMGYQSSCDKHGLWNDGIYWVIRQEAIALRSAGYRIEFCGDFNGHIGNILGKGIVGNNADVNRNGERFLSFLEECDLRHINGECRTPGVLETRMCSGLWTRQRGNSRSVIDYVALSSEHVDTVVSMTIDDQGIFWGGSDHNWVIIRLADKFRRLVRVKQKQVKKKKWDISDNQDWTAYKNAVLELLPSGDISSLSAEDLATKLTSALHAAGESSIGYKKTVRKSSYRFQTKPRYVVDALELKRGLEMTWKSLSSSGDYDPVAVKSAEEAFLGQTKVVDDMFFQLSAAKYAPPSSGALTAIRQFWAAVSGKVKQASTISSVLSSSGVLKCNSDEICEEVEKHFCSVFQGSLESFVTPEQFQALAPDHSYASQPSSVLPDHAYNIKLSSQLPQEEGSESLETNPNKWMSKDFTLAEVKLIASRLKNGKAYGIDNIPSEFLKHAPEQAFVVMALLFNKIKCSGTFPKGWNCGRVTLIHKKGLRAKLGNYRPITVLVSLSGFYSKLLNERLIRVVEYHHMLGEIQNGFRKDRCGSDNIFILNSILWKARAMGAKVHLGFVDIQKAYDSVNRAILWRKLESLGIAGDFLETLKAMYKDDSVRCTVNETTTRYLFLRRGLREGCSLSPMLFALYISEIGEGIAAAGEGFYLGGECISGLLFADDIVLVSSSAAGLRRLFRLVKHHCDKLLLEINTGEGKSEVMSPDNDRWELFDDDGGLELSLRQVLEYKYLGLETNGSIVRTCWGKQKKCIKTATKYKFACLYLGRKGTNVVDATLKTWVSIAMPSIIFGCESVLLNDSTILALERIQSQVAKCLLGVPANTANVCAQSELGMIPVRLALYKVQLSFYFRVLGLPSTTWVKKALLDHLTMNWHSPYLSYISTIRDVVRLPFIPPTMKYLSCHLYQWSLSEVNTELSNLSLPYVHPLTEFVRQPYVVGFPNMDVVAQFRLSNAGLGNKHPRFLGEWSARQVTCPLCPSNTISEAHVIFFCPAVEEFRKELGLSMFRAVCRTKYLSEEQTFTTFINGLDFNGTMIKIAEIQDRALALDTLRGHWLARW